MFKARAAKDKIYKCLIIRNHSANTFEISFNNFKIFMTENLKYMTPEVDGYRNIKGSYINSEADKAIKNRETWKEEHKTKQIPAWKLRKIDRDIGTLTQPITGSDIRHLEKISKLSPEHKIVCIQKIEKLKRKYPRLR